MSARHLEQSSQRGLLSQPEQRWSLRVVPPLGSCRALSSELAVQLLAVRTVQGPASDCSRDIGEQAQWSNQAAFADALVGSGGVLSGSRRQW